MKCYEAGDWLFSEPFKNQIFPASLPSLNRHIKAMRFLEDDMEGVYEEADKTIFRTKEEFERALLGTTVAAGE